MQTFTKTATFTANENALKNFLCSGVKFESKKKIAGATLTVAWFCESANDDVRDYINLNEASLWGVELVEING